MDAQAFEGTDADAGMWRLERFESSATPVTVAFKLSGTATWGDDYRLYAVDSNGSTTEIAPTEIYNESLGVGELVGEATIPGGSDSLDLRLLALSDSLQESTEIVTMTALSSADVQIVGAATSSIEIIDANSWLVEITSADALASESSTSDEATFTLTRSGLNSTSALTVKFEIDGSATPNTDYALYNSSSQTISLSQVSGTSKYYGYAQIPTGQNSATIRLRAVNDALWESRETATITVVPNPSYFYNVGNAAAATASITDNDAWTLNVAAHDPEGSETGSGETTNPLIFRLTRSGETDLTKATTAWFRFNGSAVYSNDFTLSSGSYNTSTGIGTITIPANSAYVDLKLSVVNDAIRESTENVGVVLINKPSNMGSYYSDYALGADFFASGAIVDNDGWTVAVEATDAVGAETVSGETSNPIVFKLTRSGETDLSKATTVYYRLSGSAQYSSSSSSSDFTVSGGSYNATDNYGSATIPAYSTSTTLTLTPRNDALYEGDETVVFTILDQSPANLYSPLTFGYTLGENRSASATLSDNDVWNVDVVASDEIGAEAASGTPSNSISFTFTRSGATDLTTATTVYYELSGTASSSDYAVANGTFTAPYGYVSIPANSTSATLTLNVTDDYLIEERENVVLRLLDAVPESFGYYNSSNVQYGLGTSNVATAFIDDNENRVVVEITAIDPLARETASGTSSDVGTFRISRSGGDASSALTVYYNVSGTAVNGTDYANLYGSATIPAGSNYVDVAVSPTNDANEETSETLVATLYVRDNYYYYGSELPYVLGAASSATIYILDDDLDPTGGPYVVPENGLTQLRAFADLETEGWTVAWDLDGDGVYGETGLDASRGAEIGSVTTFQANGLTASASPQNYPISVRVSKAETSYVASTTATVQNVAPQISLTAPVSVAVGATANFSGSFVDPGSDDWTGTILFGDETSGQNATPLTINASNKRFSISHNYAEAGWRDVVVTINDGKETSTTTRRVKVGSPAAVEISLEGSETPLISGSSTVAFKSAIGATPGGEEVDPQTGETVFRRFVVRNHGAETLTLDANSVSLPENVELVGSFPSSLAPDEEGLVTVKWTARGALNGTISIPTNDPVVPAFTVALTGAVSSYVAPTLDEISLLYDSGDDDADKITFNPILTGSVSGEFANGRVEIEFDIDSDAAIDATQALYISGQSFEFDPRTVDASWPRPASGSSNVSVRYRLVHYDDLGSVLSTGSWNSFGYTIVPEPLGTLTVSNLSFSAGWDGDWTRPGSVVLNGTIGGSGTRQIEIVSGSNRIIQTVSSSNFNVSLPFGFDYGTATSVKVRAGAYDATYKTEVYGAWTTISASPQLPNVSTLTFNQSNTETGPALVGTLASGIGRNYREVEFSCGGVLLGSAWTDENGAFTFTPKGLPVIDGVATGTVTARAVYRPTTGAPVYGTAASVAISYTPSTTYYGATTSLLETTTNSTTTSTPSFKVSGSYASNLDVAFEFRWKLSSASDWSTPKFVLGTLDSELNTDEEATNLYWNGSFSIGELYNITTSSASVSVQTRPLVYDEIFNDYVASSSWSTLSFTFVRPSVDVATISTLELASPTDGLGETTSDPTLRGSISSDDSVAGVAIKFYVDNVCIGQTTTDANGDFTYTPTGLALGDVSISAVVSQWNPASRTYVSGTAQTVAFEYIETEVVAPRLDELRLVDDTGVDGDGTTANAMIWGRIDATDREGFANLLVEYDLDGDGAPDGWTRTDASGEFYFTPELSPGARSIRVRASRWDSVAGTEIVGAWQTAAFTFVEPTNPSAPEIREFMPETYLLNSEGIVTTYSTRLYGRTSSETGFDNVRVEYEVLSGGVGTGVGNVGPLGDFCWEPTFNISGDGETSVSVRARAGRFNAETNATVWGDWTTTSFSYRAATESVLLSWKSESTDRSSSSYYERKFSGSVAPGRGVASYRVEFDVDGDGIADGQTTPNSSDDFAYYVEPTSATIYARVVDELADGTERVSSQGWQTFSTGYYNSGSSTTPVLNLYFVDDVDYVPYLQVENYVGTYSSLSISLDYDYDGIAEAYVSPNSFGQIEKATIVDALTRAEVEIKDGFSVVYAWLNSSSTVDDSDKIPVPLLSLNASSTEAAKHDAFVTSTLTLLNYDPTAAPGASSDATTENAFDYQTTPERTNSSSTTDALNVGSQSDWDVLRNTPIPEVAFPTLDGEAIDLSKDVELLQALDDVSDAYDSAVRAAQDAWSATYQGLVDAYDAAVDAAWNDYSREYARNASEFAEIQAQTWESSAEYQAIQAAYQQEYAAINEYKTEKNDEISSWYSSESQLIVDYYNDHRYDAHSSDCSGSYHTNACELRELQERKRKEDASAQLGALRSQKEISLNAKTQIQILQAEARRVSNLAEAKLSFETARNARLAALANSSAELGKNYKNAVADAIYNFYAGGNSGGLAGADETYRNAVATAAQTATIAAWNAMRTAITAWKSNASTPTAWGNYVDSLYALAQAQDLANTNAYVAQVQAAANAQKTAEIAASSAYRNYLTSCASADCLAERADVENVQEFQNAVAIATAANETATSELYSTELVSQIETSLSTRFARITEYLVNDAQRSSIWYACATSLVGVTDYTIRNAAWAETNRSLEALSKADSLERFSDEAALYRELIASGETIQTGKLEADSNLQLALWTALGAYWKAEIATTTAQTISIDAAADGYWAAIDSAEKSLALAQISIDSSYATAQIAAEETRLNDENALIQTTTQNLYGAYFASLISACGEMANEIAGDYYASVVSAIQTAFNAQVSSTTSLEASLISKATAYATATLGLDASFATSYVNAVYNYNTTQSDSNAAALNRTSASDQAEIDARIAYYRAVENANYEQAAATVAANADATRRRLELLTAWGEYVVDVAWNLENPDYDSYNYSYMNYFSHELPTTLTESPSFGAWSNGVPSQFAQVPIASTDAAVEYNASEFWSAFNSLNANVVSMQTKNAQLQRDAAVANAANSYVASFAAGYEAETRAAINDAGTELAADLSAETALNNALWAADGTAYSGYLSAIQNSDATANVLSYVNANVASSLTYASSLAGAYGDFQIANRQNKFNGTTASNPRRAAYSADVTWAQQTKSLRDQYYSSAKDAATSYYSTVTDALATYNTAALTTELAAAQDYFDAERTFSQNAQAAYNDYVLADFEAVKTQALAYLTASIAQLTADYEKEAELTQARADAYAELLDDLLADVDAADSAKFDAFSALAQKVASALAAANAADATLATSAETQLATERSENETAYAAATAAADAAYETARRDAWNDAFLETLGESAAAQIEFDAITASTTDALNAAYETYRDAIFAANDDFEADALDLAEIYAYNQARIDQGGTVAADIFENPTFDYEVCFVAGTPVLMADGTTKPIEQIRPGDQVLAADHLNPEEKPTAANVVRFFDNGEKEVVKLIFEGNQEIVCTPGHRFYVIGKGWVCAQNLQQGDLCLSATGGKIVFLSRKNALEKQRVFNFEVEKKHTYYIGNKLEASYLVHNDCPYCGSDAWEHLCIRNQGVYYEGWFGTSVRLGNLKFIYHIPFVNRDKVDVSFNKLQATVDSWRTPTTVEAWNAYFENYRSSRNPSEAIVYLRDPEFLNNPDFRNINQQVIEQLDRFQASLSELPQEAAEFTVAYALNFVPGGKIEDFAEVATQTALFLKNTKYAALIVHTTGQFHHPISKKIYKALKESTVSRKIIDNYKKFTTRAVDLESHRGYPTWHREHDAEISAWIISREKLSDEEFIEYLRSYYQRPEMAARFPNFEIDLNLWLDRINNIVQ